MIKATNSFGNPEPASSTRNKEKKKKEGFFSGLFKKHSN